MVGSSHNCEGFFFPFVSIWRIPMYVCIHVGCLPQLLSTLDLRQGLSTSLELTDLARLPGQQALGTLGSLLLQC